MLPATLQFLITMIACAINERMQRKLEYSQEEVRVLKDMLKAATGSDRIVFTSDQRRRLARGGYGSHPREMIAEIRDNGQLDWSHFLVVEEGNDVTPPLSNRRLDSTRRPTDLE